MTDLITKDFLDFPFPRISRDLSTFFDDETWSVVPQAASQGLSISEDDKHVYIEAAVPGIDPKQIDITFHKGTLWIRAQGQQEEKDTKKKYYRKASSSFSYRVTVPGEIDDDAEPHASIQNGMVTITFQKTPQAQPKKIQVQAVNK
jgi:HSP20 family protein